MAWVFADAMYFSITGPTYAPEVLTTEMVIAFVSALDMPVSVTDPFEEVPMYALPALVTASMRYPAASFALMVTVVVAAPAFVPTITDAATSAAASAASGRRCLAGFMDVLLGLSRLNVVQSRPPGTRPGGPLGP
ncbi:MAG: hypothetical protein RLZZ93_470 [Actinomycetota bacterium]